MKIIWKLISVVHFALQEKSDVRNSNRLQLHETFKVKLRQTETSDYCKHIAIKRPN